MFTPLATKQRRKNYEYFCAVVRSVIQGSKKSPGLSARPFATMKRLLFTVLLDTTVLVI